MAKPWVGAILCASFFPLLILFFKPSVTEVIGFYLVDFAAFMLVRRFDIRLFQCFYPATKRFFPDLDLSLLKVQEPQERLALYDEILKFPLRRSLYVLAVSAIKVIPGFSYLFLVWGYDVSPLMVLAQGASICAFTLTFPVGMCYLEYHNLASKALNTLHEQSNWSEVFRLKGPSGVVGSFRQFEFLSIGSVWIFWVFILVLINSNREQSTAMAISQTLYVSVIALVFISALLIAGRRQITQGINNLVEYHQSSQDKLNPSGIALSTYPVLAGYQRSLNQLIERNVSSEQEIHRWILRRAEEHRYLDLGHIAGLLVHDLITPLTVMRHCLSHVTADDTEPQSQYFDRLRFCLKEITDLVLNVRNSIRDKTHGLKQASPELAHSTAYKLVSYLYEGKNPSKVKLSYQLPSHLLVTMPQPELNQIFLNLYSNAFQNLLSNDIASPTLHIELLDDSSEFFTIGFRDNGTGLAPHAFQFITEEPEPLSGSDGIGLKLTKRLVELYGGLLGLDEAGKIGTQFQLTLRKYLPPATRMRSLFTPFQVATKQPSPSSMLM